MPSSYHNFFTTATGHLPYLWQCRLACGEPPEGANCDLNNPDKKTTEWLSACNPCASRLIDHDGPFRLSFLKTLLRAADGRASANPKKL